MEKVLPNRISCFALVLLRTWFSDYGHNADAEFDGEYSSGNRYKFFILLERAMHRAGKSEIWAHRRAQISPHESTHEG